MSDLQTRPQTPAPNLAAIPAELTARVQWVCWAYALDTNGKPTKIPYTPGTTSKASHSRRGSWRGFTEAVASYQARPDFFAGIGYVFAKDDPYVGGDIDHSLDMERVPPTYAEISPSGNGIKFIARATGDYGRKTAKGELYSKTRFFTITGNVISGHETITDCQAAVEAFAASLGTPKTLKDGSAGSGSRAERAAQIPEADWEDARHLLRGQINRLLARVRASAKEETQLAYLLRGDYAAFHQKWAFVGLLRGDGTLDDSMVRAVAATGIRGRGFTFPEYVALMTHLYGAAAVAKWGTKQAWREELSALWFKSQAPRYAPKPAPKVKAPRGRAGDHAALVEKVYQLLLEHRAGAEAIVQIADLAAAVGANRRTIASILNELRKDHISTKRFGQYGGLIITFSDVIYSAAPVDELPVPARVNDAPPLRTEETRGINCVSSESRESDHISEPPTLDELARAYWSDTANGRRVNKSTGLITRRRTAKHFADLVCADNPAYTTDAARIAYKAEQRRLDRLEREMWQRFFAWLRGLTDAELITYVAGRARASLLGVVDHTEEQDLKVNAFDKHLYATRLKCAKLQLARRGLKMPAKPTKEKPVTPAKPRQHSIAMLGGNYTAKHVAQPDLFADAPAQSPYYPGYVADMVARLKQVQP